MTCVYSISQRRARKICSKAGTTVPSLGIDFMNTGYAFHLADGNTALVFARKSPRTGLYIINLDTAPDLEALHEQQERERE